MMMMYGNGKGSIMSPMSYKGKGGSSSMSMMMSYKGMYKKVDFFAVLVSN